MNPFKIINRFPFRSDKLWNLEFLEVMGASEILNLFKKESAIEATSPLPEIITRHFTELENWLDVLFLVG